MSRLTAALVAALYVCLALGVEAAHAQSTTSQRAVLTWDTDATDIDLHVWDEDGNHAYFSDQDAIPGAELSTDILFGFGPEYLEDFEGQLGRTYTYGVCYWGSNRADGVVPETVASLEISDPDGGTRTLKRRLREEGEAFFLGSSPAGAAGYVPGDGWCRDASGPYHAVDDDGGVGQADDGSGTSVVGGPSFARCDRVRRRLGVVELCADAIVGDGTTYRMSGDVRMNGAIGVGGDITVNTQTDRISSDPVGLFLLRGDGVIPIAAGALDVDAAPTSEPVSGRTSLASVNVTAAQLQPLNVAGLPVSVTALTDGALKFFLDARDGGGLITSAKVSLPLAGSPTSTEVSIGVHGSSPAPVRVLGGAVSFPDVDFGSGWKVSGLRLAYASADDTWTAGGGFAVPGLGLDVSGSLVRGQLNGLGVTVTRDVPLGPSGFILSSVTGSVEGLAVPPLKLQLSAGARWGSVPGLTGAAVLHLKGVGISVDVSGTVTLAGRASFLTPDSRLVTGQLELRSAMAPFDARGSMGVRARFGVLDVDLSNGLRMNGEHFTATGQATGQLFGFRVASARSVVSDRGIGVSGEICAGVLGRCRRVPVGVGVEWRRFPAVDIIGGDAARYATAAQAVRSTITVEPGRPLLVVQATGDGRPPTFELRSPAGRTYTTERRRSDSAVVKDPATSHTALSVVTPEPGTWRIRELAGARRLQAQTVRQTKRVTPSRVAPSTTRRKPLARSAKRVTISWRSKNLAGVKVDVYVTRSRRDPGVLVARGRAARGRYAIARSAFAKGANYVRLVSTRRGVAVDQVVAPRAVWVR